LLQQTRTQQTQGFKLTVGELVAVAVDVGVLIGAQLPFVGSRAVRQLAHARPPLNLTLRTLPARVSAAVLHGARPELARDV